MNPKNLSLPVPYTLKMLGNGTFVAKWHPAVPVAAIEEVFGDG